MAAGAATPPVGCRSVPRPCSPYEKKVPTLHVINPALVHHPRAHDGEVPSGRAVAIDERWSFVGAKATARWLWHALDQHTGRMLAYVVGSRKDTVFLKLQALLVPFGITRYYTDKAGVY